MEKFKSKIGLVLVVIFIVITVKLDMQAFSHDSMFSGLAAAFPAMPWIFIFHNGPNFGVFGLFLIQALNIPFLYFIGLGISKIISSFRK